MNRTDSGSASSGSHRRSITAPPAAKIARQPPNAISAGARNPELAPPSEKPADSNVISAMRLLSGTYSAARARAFGMLAPRPMPVMKRHANSALTSVAVAVMTVAMPIRAKEASNRVRLPR